jgi:hypothetical protein
MSAATFRRLDITVQKTCGHRHEWPLLPDDITFSMSREPGRCLCTALPAVLPTLVLSLSDPFSGFLACHNAVLIPALLFVVSLFHLASTCTGAAWLKYLQYVALVAVAIGIPPILLKGLASLRSKASHQQKMTQLCVSSIAYRLTKLSSQWHWQTSVPEHCSVHPSKWERNLSQSPTLQCPRRECLQKESTMGKDRSSAVKFSTCAKCRCWT